MLAHSNNRWNVKTPMNTPIDDKIVSDMIAAVEVAHGVPHHQVNGYQLFSTVAAEDVHMMSKDR